MFAGETVRCEGTVTAVEGRPGHRRPHRDDPRRRRAPRRGLRPAAPRLVLLGVSRIGMTGRRVTAAGRDRRRGRVRPRRHEPVDPHAPGAGGDAGARRRRADPRRRRRAGHDRRRAVLDHAARRVPRAGAAVGGLHVRRRLGGRVDGRPRRAGDRRRAGLRRGHQLRVEPAFGPLAQPRRGARGAHAGGAVRDAVRPAVPTVVLRDGGEPVSAPVRRHARAARRDRGRRAGVGAAEPRRVPPRRRPADRRRRARRHHGVQPAHRRRLLPGHRRRGSGRGHLAGAGARPAAYAGRGARLRRALDQHVDDRGGRPHPHRRAGLGRGRVRARRHHPGGRRRAGGLRLVHDHRGAQRRGARVLRRGRGPRLHPGWTDPPGGALPLDTSGGGLSYCHPGQFGVLLLVEAVRQLRGEAGARQVPGARTAVAHGTGGILSAHATVVLGVDR